MALVLKRLFENYAYTVTDLSDQRTITWPFMKNPIGIAIIVVCYLIFVTDVGPKMMQNRKPYNLDKILIGYNIAQIILSFATVIGFLPHVWTESWICSEVQYTDDFIPMLSCMTGYLYFLTKILDLLDTIFFVLKKKEKQISFLHVYHHSIMIFITWILAKYFGGGHAVYFSFLNSIVHVIMYSYYLITAMKKDSINTLWWKKYITQIQLVQFVIIVMVYAGPIFKSDCRFSKLITIAGVTQTLALLMLFSDFYYKAYIKKAKRETKDNNIRPAMAIGLCTTMLHTIK